MGRGGVVRRACLMMFVFLGLLPCGLNGAAAQAANEQVLLGNLPVAWSDPWVKDDEASGSGQGWDQLWLDGTYGSVLVETDIPAVPAAQLRDELLGMIGTGVPVERVLESASGTYSSTVDIVRYPDGPVGILIDVYEDPSGTTLTLLVAGVSEFADAKASAEAGITVAGQPLFTNIDGVMVQTNLEAAAAQPGGAVEAPTPTPATAQDPATAPAPTPAPAVGPTPTTVPPAGTGSASDLSAGSFTIESNNWLVKWNEGWLSRFEDSKALVIWHQDARVHLEVQHFVEASVTMTDDDHIDRELEWLNADASPKDWTYRYSFTLDNDQRIVMVFSRTTPEGTLYSVSDVFVDGTHYSKVRMQAWDVDFAEALTVIQSTVTVNGAAPFGDLDLSALGEGLVPDEERDTRFTLFSSSRHVTWTPEWTTTVLVRERVSLTSTDEAVRFRATDQRYLEAADLSAAEWAELEVEGLQSDGMTDVTVVEQLELDNGQRLVLVLSWADEGKIFYSISQAVKSDGNIEMQILQAEESRLVSGLADVQAGITIGGVPPLGDAASLFPERIGSMHHGGDFVNMQPGGERTLLAATR